MKNSQDYENHLFSLHSVIKRSYMTFIMEFHFSIIKFSNFKSQRSLLGSKNSYTV